MMDKKCKRRGIMCVLALTGILVLGFSWRSDAHAIDRNFLVDAKGTEIALVAARIDDKNGRSVLRLTVEPTLPLMDKAAQEAVENFFEHFVMPSAAHYALKRVTIYVRPIVELPGGAEEKKRLFRFDRSSSGNWSLENHTPVEIEQPYLHPVTAKLADGSRISVERMQRLKFRASEGIATLLRVEILLQGFNPMAERGNVYLALSGFWADLLRAKADEEGAAAAVIVAAFEPRTRRYDERDELGLIVTRAPGGRWPSLPDLDDEIAGPTADVSLAAGPDLRFGTMDRSRFDLVLAAILDPGSTPPVASAAPRN